MYPHDFTVPLSSAAKKFRDLPDILVRKSEIGKVKFSAQIWGRLAAKIEVGLRRIWIRA